MLLMTIDFRWSVLFFGGHPQSPRPILLLRVRTVSMQCDRLGFLRILILTIAPHQKHNEA